MVYAFLIFAGAALGAIAGWVFAKIFRDLEEREMPINEALVGVAFGLSGGLLGIYWFGAYGVSGILAGLPGFALAWFFKGFLTPEKAPEFYQERRSWRSAQQVRQEEEGGLKALGLVAGLIAGGFVAWFGVQNCGLTGAILMSTIGAILAAVPAQGALITLVGVIGLGIVFLNRLLGRLTQLGSWIASRIPFSRSK